MTTENREFVREHLTEYMKDPESVGNYLGVPIANLSKEELIGVILKMGSERKRMRDDHTHQMDFMASLRRRNEP